MTRLRIVHVARDIVGTGGGEVVRQVTAHTAARGIEVVLITDSTNFEPAPGVTVKSVPGGGALLAWQPGHRLVWHLRHTIQIAWFTIVASLVTLPYRLRGYVVFNHNCESLVGQALVMHNVFSAELAERHLSPVRLVRAYMHPVRVMRLIKERVLAQSRWGKHLVAVSAASLPDVVALAGDSARVSVAANGVDLVRYAAAPEPIDAKLAHRLSGAGNVLLFVGHEFGRKGLRELIAALEHLPADSVLVVAGGAAEDRAPFLQIAERVGAASRIIFLGRVDDIRPLLGVADVFCLPSHYETMPLVALEALAAGVPVVLTPQCPAHQLIVSGTNGEVTSHDPEDIAKAITDALQAQDQVKIRHSVAGMSWESTTTSYLHIAQKISAGRQVRVAA